MKNMLPLIFSSSMTNTMMFMWQIMMMMNLFLMRRRLVKKRRLMQQMVESNKRRRARMRMIIRLLLSLPRTRKVGILRHRSGLWWSDVVPLFHEDEWLTHFRMRSTTFEWICLQLDERLKPQPRQVMEGRALPVRKVVAVAIFKIASLAEYRVVGDLFGVCKATVHKCLYAFCDAIIEVLGKHVIKLPDSEEAKKIAAGFEKTSKIPQIIGAIDGSHIPIHAPREGRADYHNRKGFHSVVLQAIVDHQYMFRDVSCQLPGSCHDIDVLKESYFYKNQETLMPKGVKSVNGWDIPYMLIGDPAYPLKSWLLKNYQYDKNISPLMDSFNVHLNKGRVVVENAFGRLKGRWRTIGVHNNLDYKLVPTLVGACCILHNICEISKDTYKDTWNIQLRQQDGYEEELENVPYNVEDSYEATDCRDHIMLYLAERFPIITSCRGRIAMEK